MCVCPSAIHLSGFDCTDTSNCCTGVIQRKCVLSAAALLSVGL